MVPSYANSRAEPLRRLRRQHRNAFCRSRRCAAPLSRSVGQATKAWCLRTLSAAPGAWDGKRAAQGAAVGWAYLRRCSSVAPTCLQGDQHQSSAVGEALCSDKRWLSGCFPMVQVWGLYDLSG